MSDETGKAFDDIMHALGRVHYGHRSKRIQKCMDLYEKRYPGIYDDEPGWTYIEHSLDDRMPEFTPQTPPLLSQEEAFQRAVKVGLFAGLVSKPEDAA